MDHICGPITALAFIKLKSTLLLLVGHGPFFQIYNQSAKKPLYSKRVFSTQAIHGITLAVSSNVTPGEHCSTECLIWGGRSICVIWIDSQTEFADQAGLKIQNSVTEVQVEDWILDVCFRPLINSSQSTGNCESEAALITSHNVVLHYKPPESSSMAERCASVDRMAAGPRSILYSAQVLWPLNGRGLVAAGTVCGEVLVWSFGHDTTSRPTPPAEVLHYTFKGHEGSVFGVRMSEEYFNAETNTSQRILASCSDDRTIKIWEISLSISIFLDKKLELELSKAADADYNDHTEREPSPLATAMGHASRIWGLHFLYEGNLDWYLLSLGEDSSTQIWHLRRQSRGLSANQISNDVDSFLLLHRATYKWHSGKSIWSSAVCRKTNDNRLICTGGSDGRLVCFNLQKKDSVTLDGIFSTQWTMAEVIENFDSVPKTSDTDFRAQKEVENLPGSIFTALEGQWKLHRNLKSARSTYPSGVFEGTALFKKRPPTDPVYHAEYLYIEDGKFNTVQGLSLSATRRYVYRFLQDTNSISVWFVKLDDGFTVDYLYHELDLSLPDYASLLVTGQEKFPVLKAKGYHLCVDDDYHADYFFRYNGLQFSTWSLKHTVKGPQKDYVADAQYTRESKNDSLKADVDLDQDINKISSIDFIKEPEVKKNLSQNTDSFKTYVWVNETEFLVSTEQGWLLLGNSSISKKSDHFHKKNNSLQIRWERIAKIKDLISSCIGSLVPFHETTLLAGTSGIIYIYRHYNKSIDPLIKISGKVSYMKSHALHPDLKNNSNAFKTAIVISCLGSSTISYLVFSIATRSSNYSKLLDLVLDRRPSFVVTSSCYVEQKGLLILGSRNGALAIYDTSRDQNDTGNVKVSCYLDRIHSDDAINVIEVIPTRILKIQSDTIFLLTAGRDGKYAIHRIRYDVVGQLEKSIDFQTVHVCTPPFGPCIEGAYFYEASNHLLLWGFRSKQFVVWNESRKMETMTVECGGSHRKWAFSPSNREPGGGMLVWTKASTCHVHSQLHASHQVLRYGGHGREIKAMASSPPIRRLDGLMQRYVATGAEDTSIRIFGRSADTQAESREPFRCLGIFPRHTTGIQQLRWSSDGRRLFSAAGCEEFFVWRIESIPCLELGMVCEAQCPPVTESSDLRIMDFDVAEIWDEHHKAQASRAQAYLLSLVYSDSSVRVRVANPQNPFPTITKTLPPYRFTAIHHPQLSQASSSSPAAPTQPTASRKPPTSASAPTCNSAPPAPTATSAPGRSCPHSKNPTSPSAPPQHAQAYCPTSTPQRG